MADLFARLIGGFVDGVVRWFVVPVTGVIPRLVEHGVLFAAFAGLWVAFGAALIGSPASLDDVSLWMGQLPFPIQAVAWLLFMPVMAGLWILGTDWPFVVRIVLIVGVAGWNLLVLLPRRGPAGQQASMVGGM